jgi:hypothetical protein
MDEETAKKVDDLKNHLTALLQYKRKREDADLEDKIERLKDEIEDL